MDYVLQEDGTLKESVALIQARLAALLKPLGEDLSQVPKLRDSLLVELVSKGELVFVRYEYLPQLLAHLKHAILQWAKHRLIHGKSLHWVQTDPRTLVDAAFGTSGKFGDKAPDHEHYQQVLTAPLLVIRAVSFIRFRAPQELIAYVLRQREERGLPTLFCHPTELTLFSTDANNNDPDMVRLTEICSVVDLTANDFPKEQLPVKAKKK